MEIPRNKPESIVWDAEWVAMHTDFHFPEVSDAAFQADFKKVMIEVAGDRLYDYRAAEQVEALLVAGNHICPKMTREAANEGFTRHSKVKDFIRLQMTILHGARDKWRGHSSIELKARPAWMVIQSVPSRDNDWRERWQKAGGKIYPALIEGQNPDHGESGMVALKNDPIWARLGDPTIFPDSLGIDHPPFYPGSWLSWRAVDEIEAVALGLLASRWSEEATARRLTDFIDYKNEIADMLERSVGRRAEAQKRSPENP